jgi:hypothetical protein
VPVIEGTVPGSAAGQATHAQREAASPPRLAVARRHLHNQGAGRVVHRRALHRLRAMESAGGDTEVCLNGAAARSCLLGDHDAAACAREPDYEWVGSAAPPASSHELLVPGESLPGRT